MDYKENYKMTKSNTDQIQKDEFEGLTFKLELKDKADEVQGEEWLSDEDEYEKYDEGGNV